MNMRVTKYFKFTFLNVLLCLLVCTQTAFSQLEDTNDFAFWSSVGVDYSIGKKLKLGVEQNIRLKDNATTIEEYFSQFNIEYELFDNFEIGVGLRHINENDDQGRIQGYENHFRYNLDVSYKYDLNRFEVSHRFRYQNKNQLGVGEEQGDIPSENLRFKTGLEYKIRNWPLDPEFSVEAFHKFSKGEAMRYNKYRLTLETSYDLDKFGKFGIYYRYERSILVNLPRDITIFGLDYSYSIN
jgi:opacity protein-like surface antigen